MGVKARFMQGVRELRGYYYVYYFPCEDDVGRKEEDYFRPLNEFASF
jgi:hypothetical protein